MIEYEIIDVRTVSGQARLGREHKSCMKTQDIGLFRARSTQKGIRPLGEETHQCSKIPKVSELTWRVPGAHGAPIHCATLAVSLRLSHSYFEAQTENSTRTITRKNVSEIGQVSAADRDGVLAYMERVLI